MLLRSVTHPTVSLLDENDKEYCKVVFPDLVLTDGQYLIINSVTKKIWLFDGQELKDWTAETDPGFDTFLQAQSGKSKISINLETSDTGYLVGSWRQYTL